MPRSLGRDEERQYAVLVAELGALTEDIKAARSATTGIGLGPARGARAARTRARRACSTSRRSRDPGAPIEPGDAHDVALGVQHLSALSRSQTFRAQVEALSPAQLAELTHVDHESHEAMVAFDASTGEGIGVARYIRVADDPETAEVTCAVLDAWQRRGVGTALVTRLAARAGAVGITRFTVHILVGDQPARRLVARVADDVIATSRTGPGRSSPTTRSGAERRMGDDPTWLRTSTG